MTTEWVIREEGDSLIRVDTAATFEQALTLAQKWISQRENDYRVEGVSEWTDKLIVKMWRLESLSLEPLTISISEWD